MGISVEPVISHRDLALVRDMRGHSGDELQVVHPLQVFGLFAIPVADLAPLSSLSNQRGPKTGRRFGGGNGRYWI